MVSLISPTLEFLHPRAQRKRRAADQLRPAAWVLLTYCWFCCFHITEQQGRVLLNSVNNSWESVFITELVEVCWHLFFRNTILLIPQGGGESSLKPNRAFIVKNLQEMKLSFICCSTSAALTSNASGHTHQCGYVDTQFKLCIRWQKSHWEDKCNHSQWFQRAITPFHFQ